MLLIIVSSLSLAVPSFSTTPHLNSASYGSNGQRVQVWFETPYFLGSGPCQYQLVVHAKTSSGFWITSLHWNFGDGSTMSVPFAAGNQVTDSRVHGYATARTYVVSVTAFDSAGNIGTGYWGLSDAFPSSCVRSPGGITNLPQPMVSNSPIELRKIAYSPSPS